MQPFGFTDEDELGITTVPTLALAVVTNNVDPYKMGRIRVQMPGVADVESVWVLPAGMPGASPGKGSFSVPRVGSTVLVGFVLGDMDEPFYLPGPTKTGAAPRKVLEQSAADAPKVVVLTETDTFEVFIVDKDDEKKLVLQTLNGRTGVELDAKDGSVSLYAAHFIKINAPSVEINGMAVQICNRPVSPLGQDL